MWSMSAGSSLAASRQYKIALRGNAPVDFSPVKRSSAAAAATSSSVTSAAAESKPWAIRYSRGSRSGSSRRLKATLLSSPLIPMTFTSRSARNVLTQRPAATRSSRAHRCAWMSRARGVAEMTMDAKARTSIWIVPTGAEASARTKGASQLGSGSSCRARSASSGHTSASSGESGSSSRTCIDDISTSLPAGRISRPGRPRITRSRDRREQTGIGVSFQGSPQDRLGDRDLLIHTELLVTGNGAVELVGAGLQLNRQGRALAGGNRRGAFLYTRAFDNEIVRDLPVVLDLEGVFAALERRLRKTNLVVNLGDSNGLRRPRTGLGGVRLRRRLASGGLGLRLLAENLDRGQHPEEQQHADCEEQRQPTPWELWPPARHQHRDDEREAREAGRREGEPDLVTGGEVEQQHRVKLPRRGCF